MLIQLLNVPGLISRFVVGSCQCLQEGSDGSNSSRELVFHSKHLLDFLWRNFINLVGLSSRRWRLFRPGNGTNECVAKPSLIITVVNHAEHFLTGKVNWLRPRPCELAWNTSGFSAEYVLYDVGDYLSFMIAWVVDSMIFNGSIDKSVPLPRGCTRETSGDIVKHRMHGSSGRYILVVVLSSI